MITEENIALEKPAAEKISIANVSRRDFLHGMLATSAFVLCGRTAPLLARAGAPALSASAIPSIEGTAFHPSIFADSTPPSTSVDSSPVRSLRSLRG